MVSHATPWRDYKEGRFRVRQRPKRQFGDRGFAYHLAELVYGGWLFLEAKQFRADYAVIHSSSTHFFVLSLFHLAGIKVIPVLHNTLWPAGYPQAGFVKRAIRRLNGVFFRNCAHAVLGVSPECLRQVRTLAGQVSLDRLIEIRGQFSHSYFDAIPAAPSQMTPFRMMFAGRITENKGVFDLIEVARKIEGRAPGLVKWDVCGDGPDFQELRFRRDAANLQQVVELHGHVLPPQLSEIIARNHAAIVPTKSTFEEGMALSAIEPVLANRPVITSSVVPAWEVLGEACLRAEVDDVESYTEQVLRLAECPEVYKAAVEACAQVKQPFLDGKLGFAAGLRRALALN